jgi:polyphenol oxidase
MRIEIGSGSLIAGVSERSDGSMVWWNRLPVDETIRANRDRYFERNGINPGRVVTGGVAHGTHVTVVGEADAGSYLLNSDGLVTNSPNLFLSVTVADCLPVFFCDPVKKAIAIAHAGWKGLVAGILEKTIETLSRTYGSDPKDLLVAVGPHIGPCHYSVNEDVVGRFKDASVIRCDGLVFIDLARESELRLRKAGVARVDIDATCTFCNAERFFSARHDRKDPLEGAVAYIGLST